MQILTFDEWKAENADFVKSFNESQEECEYCDGYGEHECTCGNSHDCEHCRGTGKVSSTDSLLHGVYESQKKKDLELLAKFSSVKP